jgi:hypothetical protein
LVDCKNLAEAFINIFERLLDREEIEFYEKDLSFLFEKITWVMLESPFWYDSATGLSSKIRKSRHSV